MKKKKETQSFGVDETTTIENQLYRISCSTKQEKKNFSKVIPKMYVNTFNLPFCILH